MDPNNGDNRNCGYVRHVGLPDGFAERVGRLGVGPRSTNHVSVDGVVPAIVGVVLAGASGRRHCTQNGGWYLSLRGLVNACRIRPVVAF